MNKKFRNISEYKNFRPRVNKVIIGAITFFISETPSISLAKADSFCLQPEQKMIVAKDNSDKEKFELQNNIGTFQLDQNPVMRSETNAEVIIKNAFNEFVFSNGEEARILEPLNTEIKEAFKNVSISAAKISGSVDERYLNVSLLLPHRLVLSINSLENFVEPEMVSFNLFRDRKLIVSDIISLDKLVKYVYDLESKLA